MWSAFAAGAGLLCAVLVVVLLNAPENVSVPIDDLAELIAPLLAAIACWLTAARSQGRTRAAWALLGASAAAWAAGQGAWTWMELVVGGTNPFPSLADVGFAASVPILLLGLFTMPVWPSGSAAKARAISDGLITAGGLVLISWHTVIGAIVNSPADTPLGQALSVAYPVCDALVVTVLLIMWSRASGARGSILLIAGGLGLISISDSTFAYQQAQNTFGSGSVIDMGWVAGFLVLGLAALHALGRPIVTGQVVAARWRSAALPYLPVLVTLAYSAFEQVQQGGISPFTLSVAIALFLLVLLRQGLAVHENISLMRRLEANESELNHRAEHDPLTDLVNRSSFIRGVDDTLQHHWTQGKLAAVMFVDLDDFKQINDSLGHSIGDQAIVAVGQRLQACMRDNDVVARLGGDEFAIFLTRLRDVGQMVTIAERLIEALNEPFESSDMRASVGGTIGIAIAEAGDDAAELLRRADIAMYAAKARGKGLFGIFEPSMHVAMYEPLERRAGLEHALAGDEFRLHYQPVVDVASRAIVGMEALIRWEHPRLGLLPPVDFINDLEASGLMVDVGSWVLDEACHQAVRVRQATGADLFVSVNVNSAQLRDGGFVSVVAEALSRSGLPPPALVTELTESGSVGESELVAAQLRQLRDMGVRVAIDDFGSGYSSFNYLRRLRVDILKIEKTFVDDLLAGGPTGALVEGMIRLGRNLGLVTVAEGVEEEAQHQALVRLGCNSAQGYLHARPMPIDQLLEVVRTWQPSVSLADLPPGEREAVAAGWYRPVGFARER
jgi:diguanylate cyclase (GGDEF)-like protein